MSERLKVKILGLSCAVRSARNTAWIVLYALKAAEKFGRRVKDLIDIETEFLDLSHREIRQCCGQQLSCLPNKGLPWKGTEVRRDFACVIKNDYMSQLWPKFEEADGLIFGSPVHQHSYTSKFRLLMERLYPWKGDFINKPAGIITTAYSGPPFGGCESALKEMATQAIAVEMVVVASGTAISGPPFGPTNAEEDGRALGVKTDQTGKELATIVGRRVAEFATMFKLAKHELGALYESEFFHYLHPPHAEWPWAWYRLDKEEEDYMRSLP
jgi:multimeric flavodoxin WrbA